MICLSENTKCKKCGEQLEDTLIAEIKTITDLDKIIMSKCPSCGEEIEINVGYTIDFPMLSKYRVEIDGKWRHFTGKQIEKRWQRGKFIDFIQIRFKNGKIVKVKRKDVVKIC